MRYCVSGTLLAALLGKIVKVAAFFKFESSA